MKKKLNLRDLIKDPNFNPILEDKLNEFKGGGNGGGNGASWDCVFRCFDYLDGDAFSRFHYQTMATADLYYDASDMGGVYTSDIPTIGGFGTLNVNETGGIGSFDNSTGKLNNGKSLTILIPGASDGFTHMVVVENVLEYSDGTKLILYYDPTTNSRSGIVESSVSNYFEVGSVGSYNPWGSGAFGGSGEYEEGSGGYEEGSGEYGDGSGEYGGS